MRRLSPLLQEALRNAVRRANARRIGVELCTNDSEFILQVEDDGTGMPHDARGGMGLRTMAYRAQILDGELTIEPAPGGGTRVVCHVPQAGAQATGHHV